MAKITLVTGGARSGKSTFAEEQLLGQERVCYIATGLSPQNDPDWQERVRLHQERRPKSWQTQEQYQDLSTFVQTVSADYLLLDCATMLTTNLLFDWIAAYYPEKMALRDDNFLTKKEQAHLTELMEKEWLRLLSALKTYQGETYIVTNEVGLGIVPETSLGRFFRDLQGKMNQLIAKEASEVYLVICGLAQRLK